MPDSDIPELPQSPDYCPISELLGKRVSQMNDPELDLFVRETRTVIESPQALRKAVSKRTRTTTEKKDPPAKLDIDKLFKLQKGSK